MRSVFFCGQIAILIPLYKPPRRRPPCVNSKLCKLLKLAILLISSVEFCSWTMHTDAVVLLTGLSFSAVWMSLAETASWLSLQYLLIDAFIWHRILSQISFPACGLEWSYITSSIPWRCLSSRKDDTSLLLWWQPGSSNLRKPFFIPGFCNFMVTKRFSRTDSAENQSCLRLLRRCT